MTQTKTVPAEIARYFELSNQAEPDAVAACFTTDARVKDEGEWRQGRDAIADWARSTRARYQHHSTPLDATAEAGSSWIVAARVEGNFAGSPVTLRYRFEMDGGAIKQLEIVAA